MDNYLKIFNKNLSRDVVQNLPRGIFPGPAFRVKNCCANGLYAELRFYFKTRTHLVVRATGSSCGYSRKEGFRSLAIAEVKWSKPITVEGEAYYATGLKYWMI